ncbi:MAG: hypothetical protein OXB93_00965, partial [Cytophagales bacterium]|nr:hypothetical protein [Cytophagales bacterium]
LSKNRDLFFAIYEKLPYDQLIWEFGTYVYPRWIHVSYRSEEENRNQTLHAFKEVKTNKTQYLPFRKDRVTPQT